MQQQRPGCTYTLHDIREVFFLDRGTRFIVDRENSVDEEEAVEGITRSCDLVEVPGW